MFEAADVLGRYDPEGRDEREKVEQLLSWSTDYARFHGGDTESKAPMHRRSEVREGWHHQKRDIVRP